MKRRSLVPFVCGLLTALVTVVLVSAIKVDVFSAVALGFVPVGALAVGALAGSGLFAALHRLHLPAQRGMWIQAGLLAGLTLLGVFYGRYLHDGVSEGMSFVDYLRDALASAVALAGEDFRHPGVLDSRDQLLGGLRVLGVLIGGIAPGMALRMLPRCGDCDHRLHRSGKDRTHVFADAKVAAAYLDAREEGFDLSPLDHALPVPRAQKNGRNVRVTARLLVCEGCGGQRLVENVSVFSGGWKDVETLGLRRRVPAELDLRGQFRRA